MLASEFPSRFVRQEEEASPPAGLEPGPRAPPPRAVGAGVTAHLEWVSARLVEHVRRRDGEARGDPRPWGREDVLAHVAELLADPREEAPQPRGGLAAGAARGSDAVATLPRKLAAVFYWARGRRRLRYVVGRSAE